MPNKESEVIWSNAIREKRTSSVIETTPASDPRLEDPQIRILQKISGIMRHHGGNLVAVSAHT